MQSAVVLNRSDLCENVQDLPFGLVEIKHFNPVVLDTIVNASAVLFFDDPMMKILKNTDGDCGLWTVHQATRGKDF